MIVNFNSLILYVVPLLIAIVLHEISHAVAAYALGDNTARNEGRFNLHTHFDLFGSFLLPLMLYMSNLPLFGYAKPVPVNSWNFEDPKADMALVALVGPLCNAVLASISAFLLQDSGACSQPAIQFLVNFTAINITLCLFNLVPIPPLDGSRIVSLFLPYQTAMKYESIEPYGMIVIWALCNLGVFAGIDVIVRNALDKILP
ncbi:site-2 protease family protein [Alphaproteobacteria bacterium]|nr:site-2 protease family protein [Alphaproteobacteria bacterium]